jgi:hypothetical protein
MTKLLWEIKVIVCDICKERSLKKTIRINGKWKGVCEECEPKGVKNEPI